MFEEMILPIGEEITEGQIADVCDYGTEQHCKSLASKINEATVSEDPTICVEYAKCDSVGD